MIVSTESVCEELLGDPSGVEKALRTALRRGATFAEVFVEDRASTSAVLDDGRVEDVSTGWDRGAGIRVVKGESTGFAHTTDLSPEGLVAAAEAAAEAVRSDGGGGVRVVALRAAIGRGGRPLEPPWEVPKRKKVELLAVADREARAKHPAVFQVSAHYADSRRRILVANTEGLFASDEQVRTLFAVTCVARGDSGMQTGREAVGRTGGFELFADVDVASLAARAAERAVSKLEARPAPAGSMPVVIAAGGGGVLFHEACGHGLEADLVEKGASVFRDKRGELVASELVTLVDDGTMAGEWGCLGIDDEGHPTLRNVLIRDGVLTDYMSDWTRARRQGRPSSSGNGRRQSFRHLPMVRMTNTFLLPGPHDPAEIVASTEKGVYVEHLGGGQVNTATGDFVFGMTEAYLIENGEITTPIRDGNLTGNGPEVLRSIDAVGNDFAMGPPGTCGKDGQGVPVGDGMPTVRVTALTIGGTAA